MRAKVVGANLECAGDGRKRSAFASRRQSKAIEPMVTGNTSLKALEAASSTAFTSDGFMETSRVRAAFYPE
jgi:hypothetical protein